MDVANEDKTSVVSVLSLCPGVTGGVGGALCGIAIGGLAGYSLGSFIESLI